MLMSLIKITSFRGGKGEKKITLRLRGYRAHQKVANWSDRFLTEENVNILMSLARDYTKQIY